MDFAFLAAADNVQQRLSLVSIDPGTIIFTLINTLLIILAYRFFLHKKVTAMLDKRNALITEEMEGAAAAREKAELAEKEYRELLANSKEEARGIIADAVQKAQAREDAIIAEAENSASQIRLKAEESIELEKRRAVNEIKNQIAELVIIAAGAVAEKEINESDNRALIESFIMKADGA